MRKPRTFNIKNLPAREREALIEIRARVASGAMSDFVAIFQAVLADQQEHQVVPSEFAASAAMYGLIDGLALAVSFIAKDLDGALNMLEACVVELARVRQSDLPGMYAVMQRQAIPVVTEPSEVKH